MQDNRFELFIKQMISNLASYSPYPKNREHFGYTSKLPPAVTHGSSPTWGYLCNTPVSINGRLLHLYAAATWKYAFDKNPSIDSLRPSDAYMRQ